MRAYSSLKYLALALGASAILVASACATGSTLTDGSGGAGTESTSDGTGSSMSKATSTGTSMAHGSTSGSGSMSTTSGCTSMCDSDGDGVLDGMDTCADTPKGEAVNDVGCSDSQVDPELQETWPPYGLSWVPTGNPGRPLGLTWTYTNINHANQFHIYWVICDDPATPCGLSLDGPIDMTEKWQFSAGDSSLAAGKVVFLSATHIALADGTSPAVTARMTVNITDGAGAAIPVADLLSLGIMGKDGQFGAEIPGAGFVATILVEVQDGMGTWVPYLDYYDNAPTPDPAPGATISISGSFYDE